MGLKRPEDRELGSTPWMGRRVLITGGGGFVGWHLVDQLTRIGATVMSVSRQPGRLARLKPTGQWQYETVDLTHVEDVIRIVGRFHPHIVFHFASHPDGAENHEHAVTSMQTNLMGTVNLLEAMRQAGCGELVFGDSCKVYGNADVAYRSDTPLAPNSSYSISKAAGWQICEMYSRLHGMAAVSIRPTMMYGPHQGRNLISFVIRGVLEGKTSIALDGGSQTRDPLYVDDGISMFIAAGAAASRLRGRAINIGGGQELTVAQIAQTIVDLMGGQTEIVTRASQARTTEMWRSRSDNSEAAEWLGWRPAHTLHAGLRATIAFEKSHPPPAEANSY